MRKLRILCWLACSWMCGCAHTLVPGTKIPDTADTRAVLDVLVAMRAAFEARDANALLALVSPRYFEDLGDDNPANDYGYTELKERVLPQTFTATKEMRLEFDVHDIVVEGDQAHADIRYRSRAQLELPGGARWDSHRDFDRIELVREQGAWKILKGL